MKNIVFLLASFLVFSCHKKDETPDYAAQVVGTYTGTYSSYSSYSGTTTTEKVTVTVTEVGKNKIQLTAPFITQAWVVALTLDANYSSPGINVYDLGEAQYGASAGRYTANIAYGVYNLEFPWGIDGNGFPTGFYGTKQ